jgi:hypothetical protein
MPANTPCALGPEVEHARVELTKLGELLETEDRTLAGNAALRLAYLARTRSSVPARSAKASSHRHSPPNWTADSATSTTSSTSRPA